MTDWNFDWIKDAGCKQSPNGTRIFNTAEFGAVGDALADDTAAIQNTLDAAEAAGGGVVTFEPGIFLSGSLFVGNNTEFNIPKGTMILGSQNIADYREIDTRVAGVETKWPAALVNIIGKTRSAITGDGTIHGHGKVFWDQFWDSVHAYYEPQGLRWAADYDCRRPRGILVQDCRDITVSGVVIYQAGFWSLQILYSRNVTATGLVISNNIEGHGPSTDGIDIDSSEYVLVENSKISCNDDNFCLKAGRDADGQRVNRKTEYVVIRNCTAGRGCGLVTFGSETSGTIRNVLVENVRANGTYIGINFKSALIRGGGVRDIYIRDVEMKNVTEAIWFNLNWFPEYSIPTLPEAFRGKEIPELWKKLTAPVDPVKGIPFVSDVHIRNLRAEQAGTCIKANGMEKIPIRRVTIENSVLSGKAAGELEFAQDWLLVNTEVKGEDGELKIAPSCSDIKIRATQAENRAPKIFLAGDSTVSNYCEDQRPMTGWGQVLQGFCRTENTVSNHAKPGASCRSFIREHRWSHLLDGVQAGDWVVIQFGHNDQKIAADRSTYQQDLKGFVADVRARKANPVLVTSIPRRWFRDGRIINGFSGFPEMMRQVAVAEQVPLIDLNSQGEQQLAQLGSEKTEALYMLNSALTPTSLIPDFDLSHLTREGAEWFVGMFVAGVKAQSLPLAALFK